MSPQRSEQRHVTWSPEDSDMTVHGMDLLFSRFFKGVLGTRFGSVESEKIGSLESEKLGPYRFIPGI